MYGPHTVLAAQEEIAIAELLVCVVSQYVDVTTQGPKEGVPKLFIDGRYVPRDPDEKPGPRCMKASFKRHPRLTLRSGRICELKCVISDDRSPDRSFVRVSFFCFSFAAETPHSSQMWNTDEPGDNVADGRIIFICVSLPYVSCSTASLSRLLFQSSIASAVQQSGLSSRRRWIEIRWWWWYCCCCDLPPSLHLVCKGLNPRGFTSEKITCNPFTVGRH